MSKSAKFLRRSAYLGCTAFSALAVGLVAYAGGVRADDAIPETVIITGTVFNPTVAPAKANPDTTEPQTIIDKTYIEDSVTATADYVQILAIAPSLTGTDINGPGLSDGSVKNTLRGLPDGQYGMTFDGIPFGDTNGPSHHSASYFPGTDIGAIEVDRGPGNAGTLGAATYGGSINLYSEPLREETRATTRFTYGSFQTFDENFNFQSGNLDTFGKNTRILINFQETTTQGALTLQSLKRDNILLKTETDIAPNWTVTLFSTYNRLHQVLDDNNGATPAQINRYGKDFALQNTNPALPTYADYNPETKYTDMDYIRVKGSVTTGFKVDDTFYSYAYVNKTFSPRSILQTDTEINNNTAEGIGGNFSTSVNGTKFATDIPGYAKLNSFRVWGNIFRASQDYDFGMVKGQIRAGLWWETASTPRARIDYDVTKCVAAGINPWYNSDVAFSTCGDASLSLLGSKSTSILSTGHGNPTYNGYVEFVEHSSWNQYQPFLEVDLIPIDGLTITPGVKYVHWDHSTRADIEPKLLPPQPYTGSFTTTAVLPFAEANYKIMPNWSVYAQYAQGIYVPDVSAFQQKTPVLTFPAAQTTTNYQVGTVFYGDNFTFDADLYYIPINNNITSGPCDAPFAADTCFTNTGTATYQGIEGEGTYAFGNAMGGMFNGLVAFANGSLNSAKSNGLFLKQAPMWTAAMGLIYKHNGIKFSLIDKLVGPQYMDNAETQAYRVNTYNTMSVGLGYDFGPIEVGLSMDNALGTRNIASITINDKTLQPWQTSLNQYYFQAPRSIMLTIKGRLD